ncbi:MAG: sensor domain-containing diguanylate cyclase [Actinomycetota bacterium]
MPENEELRQRLSQVQARLVETERELFEASAKYAALMEQLPAAIYIDEPDPNGKTLYVSPHVQQVLGLTPDEYMALAAEWGRMIHPDDRARVNEEYEAFLANGDFATGDYRYLRPDGSVVWIHDRSHLVLDADGKPLFVQGVMFDVTEQKENELRLAHLAYHDALTGLPNRAMFAEHLDLALARASRRDLAVAVLFVDLDDFKAINDSFGHSIGDEVLKVAAERLTRATRATDLVARQSGDEFLILMADLESTEDGQTARDAVGIVEQRISEIFAETLLLGGHEVSPRASTGSAVYPFDGDGQRDLLRHADSEMYERKRDAANQSGRMVG